MVNIFFGKTSEDAFSGVIEKLLAVASEKNSHHIFVVPDRMSVVCEKRIFEQLGIESTCNIEVVTLSRLCARILKDKKIVSKNASCMILQKILKDCAGQLKCFDNKFDADLAETLFGTISQLKSCKVNVEDVLVPTQNSLLRNKLDDIKLVYQKYQQHMKAHNLIDSMDRLDMLPQAMKNSPFVASSRFYVAKFDSFTFQGYEVISSLAKYAKELNIGVVSSQNSANMHIYNQNFVNNISNFLSPFSSQVFFCKEKCEGAFKILQDNLFSFLPSVTRTKDCPISLFEGKDFEEEVVFVCSKIKDFVVNKHMNFDDFFVAVPNLQSKAHKIERIFEKFGFNYFLDVQLDFSTTAIAGFLKRYFNLFVEDFSTVSILSFLKSPFLNLDFEKLCDFEDCITKFGATDRSEIVNICDQESSFFENYCHIRDFFESFETSFDKTRESKTFGDFVVATNFLLEKIDFAGKMEFFLQEFEKQNNLKQKKLFEQFEGALQDVLHSIQDVLGEEECSLKVFVETLFEGIKSTKISTPPLSIDAIFVGDPSVSFFENRRIGFVIGACEGSFPTSKIDCGLIADKEIDELSERYKLEPSIAQINAKERFKCFELCLTPKEQLFLSYNFADGERCKIFDDVQKMFVLDNGKSFAPILIEKLDFNTKNSCVAVAKTNLTSALRKVFDGEKSLDEEDKRLFNLMSAKLPKDFVDRFFYKNIQHLKNNVFFEKNKTSASQIECFMTCPFLHFARYGLRLTSKHLAELNPADIGTLLHSVFQELFENSQFLKDETNTDEIVLNIFNKKLCEKKFVALANNKKNKVIFENLKKESLRVANAMKEQSKLSKFVPTYFEMRFDDFGKVNGLKIKHNGKTISLVGQVDRIDVFQDYFRIVDYKTGNVGSSLKELFFGKKIQLEAYLKSVANSLHLKPCGAYYLPIKTTFKKDVEEEASNIGYSFVGNTLDNPEVLFATDTTFEKGGLRSAVVDVKLKQNDNMGIVHAPHSKVVKSFEGVMNYAQKLIENAVSDILSLNITPFPLVLNSIDPCQNCEHRALCRFDESFENQKRIVTREAKKDLSIESFEKETK